MHIWLAQSGLTLVRLLQWRATRDFADPQFLGPRIVDKVVLALIIMTLYWKIGENRALSNYSNLTAVLFLWTILPGYAATAFIPTIVLERPLFVRCAAVPHAHAVGVCPWCRNHVWKNSLMSGKKKPL